MTKHTGRLMEKQVFYMVHDMARKNAMNSVATAPHGYRVEIREPSRSLDQNAAQWPYLQAFAEQVQWPINGVLTTITPDDWKDILTAAYRADMVRVAPSFDGRGMVMLGQRTSRFGKKEFSDWLEFLKAAASERGVVVYEDEVA